MRVAALLAGTAGVAAAVAPAAPTGSSTVDPVLLGVSVALVVLVGARAAWWMAALAALVAMATTIDPVLTVIALAAFAAALVVARTASPAAASAARSVVIGVAMNVLARSELELAMGVSAAVAVVTGVALLVAGLARGSRRMRWLAAAAAATIVLVGGAATAMFGLAVAESRHDLRKGLNDAELGVAAIENGNFEDAIASFRAAAEVLERASDRVSTPLGAPAGAIPVIAQHRRAVVEMSAAGAEGARTVVAALEELDLDALRPIGGRLDLDAITALATPLADVRDALVELQGAADRSDSPWLVERARVELDDFDASIDEHLPQLERALAAIERAPAMLGGDRPRRYLVLFTTPSEARGLGGMVGSYAELTADDGRLSLGQVGRAQDFDGTAHTEGIEVRGPEGFLAQYGRFMTGDDGRAGRAPLRNVAMSPHFPWVGEVAADLYTRATGRPVDGVIALDPFVLARLIGYTGPIQLASLEATLTADNAVAFLLLDQYVLDDADVDARADALAEAAALTFERLLGGALPDPIALARDLGPLTGERRLAMWSADADEQALLAQMSLSGRLPDPTGRDGWGVTVTNAGGSKIDHFLRRRVDYDVTVDPATGDATATLRIQLTNTAPAEGLPDYVIGNEIRAPRGTSRLYVSSYSPFALTGATQGGEAIGLAAGRELGWNVYSGYVELAAGESVVLELDLRGAVSETGDPVTWMQPLGTPMELVDDL